MVVDWHDDATRLSHGLSHATTVRVHCQAHHHTLYVYLASSDTKATHCYTNSAFFGARRKSHRCNLCWEVACQDAYC